LQQGKQDQKAGKSQMDEIGAAHGISRTSGIFRELTI
jgi:hypothetical protein